MSDDGGRYEGIPPCPGCGRSWDQATVEYTATEYNGEVWHYGCAFDDRDDVKRAGARKCPNCYAYTVWRPDDADTPERRLCHGCGQSFNADPDVIDDHDLLVGWTADRIQKELNDPETINR